MYVDTMPNFKTGVYIVYIHRGKVKIKKGNLKYNGLFVPDGSKYYHCGLRIGDRIPDPLERVGIKLWVEHEEDIQRAIEILMDRRSDYVKEIGQQATKAKETMLSVEWEG